MYKPMPSGVRYVPILRWKLAERRALRDLRPDVRTRITPLIELTPWAYSNKKSRKPKTPEQKLTSVAVDIFKMWGNDLFLIDLQHTPVDIVQKMALHPFDVFAREARMRLLKFVPVTGLQLDDGYQAAVKRINDVNHCGICIRAFSRDLASTTFVEDMEEILGVHCVVPEQADLVLDCQDISDCRPDLVRLIAFLPYVERWRSLTVASGVFPVNLGKYDVGEWTLERLDWLTWRTYVTDVKPTRVPDFSDYTIQHPIVADPPDNANPSASIRYTAENHWVIMRGESIRKENGPGRKQWPAQARMLMRRPEFKGTAYSKGDEYITVMGKQNTEFGTAETWLRAGFNHHLTLVTEQIANLFGDA